jgi:hypothetical protein
VVGSINGERESIMPESDQTALREQVAAALGQLRGIKIDEQAVLSHVIRRAHVMTAISDQGAVEALAPHPPGPHPPPVPPVAEVYVLGVDDFIADIHQALEDDEGYVIALHQYGLPYKSVVSGYAHQPQDGTQDWAFDVRQHVASLSKHITAMAMTRALIAAGLPRIGSTPIIDYLPTYWAKGPNIDQITIAELLTHTSGITQDTNSTPADFQTMKEVIAAGVSASDIGTYEYRNVNFTLCRVLLATITGEVPVDWAAPLWPWTVDQAWDLVTTLYYQGYVATNVFAPAGVNGPSLKHRPADALAYPFSLGAAGWNSGDLSTLAGADAWHMSVEEVLAVMGTFRRTNAIVDNTPALNMLDYKFGIDCSLLTPLGFVYWKSGYWSNGSAAEQGVLFYLPEDMELVVLVNSPIGSNEPDVNLGSLVYNAYKNNIKAVPVLLP